jgi:hypothetical protein
MDSISRSSIKLDTKEKQNHLWETEQYGEGSVTRSPISLFAFMNVCMCVRAQRERKEKKNRPVNSITESCRWLLHWIITIKRLKNVTTYLHAYCELPLNIQWCLHSKERYLYLNRSPSHLALSADASSQRQKGWLLVQQSGTIKSLLQALL